MLLRVGGEQLDERARSSRRALVSKRSVRTPRSERRCARPPSCTFGTRRVRDATRSQAGAASISSGAVAAQVGLEAPPGAREEQAHLGLALGVEGARLHRAAELDQERRGLGGRPLGGALPWRRMRAASSSPRSSSERTRAAGRPSPRLSSAPGGARLDRQETWIRLRFPAFSSAAACAGRAARTARIPLRYRRCATSPRPRRRHRSSGPDAWSRACERPYRPRPPAAAARLLDRERRGGGPRARRPRHRRRGLRGGDFRVTFAPRARGLASVGLGLSGAAAFAAGVWAAGR